MKRSLYSKFFKMFGLAALWMVLAGPTTSLAVDQATQADVADLLIRVTGLRSQLPEPAVFGDKARVLSNYDIVPVGGWNADAPITSWQIALLMTQAFGLKKELPAPFKNNLALDKPVAIQEGVLNSGAPDSATDGDEGTAVTLSNSGWMYVDLGKELIVDMISHMVGQMTGIEKVYVLGNGEDPSVFPGAWKELSAPKELQGLVPTAHWIEPLRCRYVLWKWDYTGVPSIQVSEVLVCNYFDQLSDYLLEKNVISNEIAQQSITVKGLEQFYEDVSPLQPASK